MKGQTVFKEIIPTIAKNAYQFAGAKAFIHKYSEVDTEDVDWLTVCRDVEAYDCPKLALHFMVKLLDENLYCGEYAEKLYSRLPQYHEMFGLRNATLKKVFCGKQVEQQAIYTYKKTNKTYWPCIVHIDTCNPVIIELVESSVTYTHAARYCTDEIVEDFGKSLGEAEPTIRTMDDFTAKTFFAQVEYYRQKYKDSKSLRAASFRFVIHFYRWLINANPDHKYFDADNMSERLMFNNRLSELLERGFYFTTFNPTNIPYGQERVCFILRGLESASTTISPDDSVPLDLSGLTSRFYRDLLLEYIVVAESTSAIKRTGYPASVKEVMEALYQAKQSPSYPNKKLAYLTNQEAVFIKRFFNAQDNTLSTKNNKIGVVRRFLLYCVDKGAIQVPDLFFDYLTQYEEPGPSTARAVPDAVLGKLSEYFGEKAKTSIFYKEMFAIFHLAIQTELRISQICHLRVDCIRPTVHPSQYEIVSNSKTSHGMKNHYVISSITYNILMDIIEETESIREALPVDTLKPFIFVYLQTARGNRPVLVNSSIFSDTMAKACKTLGVERYTAANLRDTHMTKALEHIIRTGKSDLELSVLSKHKHVDTTKAHYIEKKLDDMLEATYGIIIGGEALKTSGKVVDEIPMNLQGAENTVENGCGTCTAATCTMSGPLPCLTCSSFITTPKHALFFKKGIENIDRLIKTAKNRHDVEDLTTAKKLYVLYLKAIYEHEEGLA